MAGCIVGDFERGWPEHEWRSEMPAAPRLSESSVPSGAARSSRQSIVLHAEQGYGDTLQFIRYASLVKQRGGMVFVALPVAIAPDRRSLHGVDMAFDGIDRSALPGPCAAR